MKNMSLLKQMWFSAGFSILMTSFIGFFGIFTANRLAGDLDQVSAMNLPAARYMGDIDMMHDNIRANIFAASHYRNLNDQQGIESAITENNTAIDRINKDFEELAKISLSKDVSKLIEENQPPLKKYIVSSQEILQLFKMGQTKEALGRIEGFAKAFDELEVSLEKLGEQVEKDSHMENAEASFKIGILYVATGFSILLGFFITFLVVSRMKKTLENHLSSLSHGSKNVTSISQKLSASNVQLSANATETASSLEETVASLEELSSMVNLNSDNSQKSYKLSLSAKKMAEEGEKGIQKLSDAIFEIKDDSRKMEEIVNVIDDISFQTNLLALNAAVEAARAGDQGKGFAVVADAVRSLAQRSSTSAKEINQMIKDSISKVESSSVIASECNDSLKKIVDHVNQVTDLSNQIASASQEQSAGLKQINQAMIQLDAASQENASSAEALSKASSDADTEASKMSEVVHEMIHFVFGENNESLNKQGPDSATSLEQFKAKKKQQQQTTKKVNIDLGSEPKDNKIKKVENF